MTLTNKTSEAAVVENPTSRTHFLNNINLQKSDKLIFFLYIYILKHKKYTLLLHLRQISGLRRLHLGKQLEKKIIRVRK